MESGTTLYAYDGLGHVIDHKSIRDTGAKILWYHAFGATIFDTIKSLGAAPTIMSGSKQEKMKLADMHNTSMGTMRTTVTVILIVAAAALFGKAITLYQIPQEVTAFVATTFNEPWASMIVICAVLLLMGLFLESLSMLLIVMPVLLESLAPVGMNLFVIQAVAKAELNEVIRGVWPFVLMMLFTAFLLWFVPDLALYIPYKL